MTSWFRNRLAYSVDLLPYKVEIDMDQVEHSLSSHTWLRRDIAESIKADNAFNAYVVMAATPDGKLASTFWWRVVLITGPYKGEYAFPEDTQQDYHRGDNVEYASRSDWFDAVYEREYKLFISFETKKEAMLFKLIYG